jgi:acyl-CoA synthetase (AMP-forming)/AMP-acid ligase II
MVDELIHYFKISGIKVVFAGMDYMPVTRTAAKAVGISLENIILLDGAESIAGSLQSMALDEPRRPGRRSVDQYSFPAGQNATSTVAFLSFSSGTTGLAKAVSRSSVEICIETQVLTVKVRLCHANMIAQGCQIEAVARPQSRSNVCLAVLPFFHSKSNF